jgi:hypothetical protein
MTNDAEQAIDQALANVTWMTSLEAFAAAQKAGTPRDFRPVREQIQFLLASTHPGLDERILEMLPGESPAKGRAVLCRILAERDPDRDPQYALDVFAGSDGLRGRWLRKRIFRFMGTVASASTCGIDRLRRLKPVEHLTRETTRWSFMARSSAVMRLGDTADPAAVPVLINALKDKSWGICVPAVYSVRTLHLAGALPSVESVADLLVEQLSHSRLNLVEAAAGALVDLGLTDRLTRDGLTNPDAVKIVDLAVDGRVCLPQARWPGHEGYGSDFKSVLKGGGRHP